MSASVTAAETAAACQAALSYGAGDPQEEIAGEDRKKHVEA
jgi:hypothetical protein